MEPAWNLPHEALTVRPEGFLFFLWFTVVWEMKRPCIVNLT